MLDVSMLAWCRAYARPFSAFTFIVTERVNSTVPWSRIPSLPKEAGLNLTVPYNCHSAAGENIAFLLPG